MASVWKEMKGQQPVKVAGMMNKPQVQAALKAEVNQWVSAGPNRTVKQGAALTVLLFEDAKLAGSLFIEPASPPSKPEPGQPHVAKGGA